MKRKIGYILLFLSGLNVAPLFWAVISIIIALIAPRSGIGIIGGADGPTAVFIADQLIHYLAPVVRSTIIQFIIGVICLTAAIILLKKKKLE